MASGALPAVRDRAQWEVAVTASDGERRAFKAGDVVLVEDTTGKGHLTRMSGDGLHRAAFVPAD